MRAGCLLLVFAFSSCGPFIEYTDNLRRSKDNTPLVRYTAQFGGLIGVIVSIPVVIVASPVTIPVHYYNQSVAPETADLTDSWLFPAFVLRGVGSLLALPVDLIEFATYRAWVTPDTPTSEEQEEHEMRLDDEAFPQYPVETIYPPKKAG